MSSKLRELIKKVRACKTAEEERSVINKESAEMRNMSREANDLAKCRNLLKCIYMHMMVTTVNILASQNFTYKRMAYTALSLLLDEKSDVLLLSTQTIKKDLQSPNTSVVAMALNAIGEICTAEMCRELASEVATLMRSDESYIKKKAACSCSKIIRKCPELLDTFIKLIPSYIEDKHHGVLLSGLSLLVQIFNQDSTQIKKFVKYIPNICKYLKNLISISYSPEYDVNGITDPFLQAKLVESLSFLGSHSSESFQDLQDTLSSVSTSTESSKTTGNAILYELVRTINSIKADTGLKSLASTIMGKFLTNRDNNFKYIALNTLREVVKVDPQTVQKHKNTILACLKDEDISIRRRALDLVYLIISTNNVKSVVKECLDYLTTTEDHSMKLELTTKISQSISRYTPNSKWLIDTYIKMLCLSENFVTEDTISLIINEILKCESMKIYSVHKCFLALKNHQSAEALSKVCIYILGDWAQELITNSAIGPDDEDIIVNQNDLLNLLESIQHKESTSSTVKEYLMNSYLKLSTFGFPISRIQSLLEEEVKSYNCEVQQRACDYLTSFKVLKSEILKEITKPSPSTETSNIKADLEDGEENEEDKSLIIKLGGKRIQPGMDDNRTDLNINMTSISNNTNAQNNKINLLDIFGNSDFSTLPSTNLLQQINILDDLTQTNLNSGVNSNLNFTQSVVNNSNVSNLLVNLDLGLPNFANSNLSLYNNNNKNNSENFSNTYDTSESKTSAMKLAFSNNLFEIKYSYRINLDGSIDGSIYVSNNSTKNLNNFNLKFMVIRTVQLKVISTSGTSLLPMQQLGIKKDFSMINTDASKKIVMKIKFSYNEENSPEVFDVVVIDDFN